MADETCLFPIQRLPRNPVARLTDDSVLSMQTRLKAWVTLLVVSMSSSEG